jgi:uncharacterized lipoprotein YmbA
MMKHEHGWQVGTLLVALLLSGCAASGPPFQKVQIPEGRASSTHTGRRAFSAGR